VNFENLQKQKIQHINDIFVVWILTYVLHVLPNIESSRIMSRIWLFWLNLKDVGMPPRYMANQNNSNELAYRYEEDGDIFKPFGVER